MSSLFGAIGIAASGMQAERVRMDVTSDNLANADSTGGPNGVPYQRKQVVRPLCPARAISINRPTRASDNASTETHPWHCSTHDRRACCIREAGEIEHLNS